MYERERKIERKEEQRRKKITKRKERRREIKRKIDELAIVPRHLSIRLRNPEAL